MSTDILTSFSNMDMSDSSDESSDDNYERLLQENYELTLKLNTAQIRLFDKAELLQTHELRRFAKRMDVGNYRKMNHLELLISLKKKMINR